MASRFSFSPISWLVLLQCWFHFQVSYGVHDQVTLTARSPGRIIHRTEPVSGRSGFGARLSCPHGTGGKPKVRSDNYLAPGDTGTAGQWRNQTLARLLRPSAAQPLALRYGPGPAPRTSARAAAPERPPRGHQGAGHGLRDARGAHGRRGTCASQHPATGSAPTPHPARGLATRGAKIGGCQDAMKTLTGGFSLTWRFGKNTEVHSRVDCSWHIQLEDAHWHLFLSSCHCWLRPK